MNKSNVKQLKAMLGQANRELKESISTHDERRILTLQDEISTIKTQLKRLGEKV